MTDKLEQLLNALEDSEDDDVFIPVTQDPSGTSTESPSSRGAASQVPERSASGDRKEMCEKCGNFGHIAVNCPVRVVCEYCGNPGHYSTNCPKWICENVTCYRCGKKGHYAPQCYNSKEEKKVKCYKCGGAHYANECWSKRSRH